MPALVALLQVRNDDVVEAAARALKNLALEPQTAALVASAGERLRTPARGSERWPLRRSAGAE